MTDFSGLATVYGVLCNDGRVIKQGAFDHQHGQTVPIVWRHDHGTITNVLGHGTLMVNESPPGMRVEGTFNTTKEGRQGKQLVDSRDITNLSIWANEVVEHGSTNGNRTVREVEYGVIREVSLVLSGANPGAVIDDHLRHSGGDPLDFDEFVMDGIIIHTDLRIDPVVDEPKEVVPFIHHEDESIQDILKTLTPDQTKLFEYMLKTTVSDISDEEVGEPDDGPTVDEVFNTLSQEQKDTLYYLVGEMKLSEEDSSVQHEDVSTVEDVVATFDKDQLEVLDMTLANLASGEKAPENVKVTSGRSVEEVVESMNQEQIKTMLFLAEQSVSEDEEIQQGDIMKRNVFEDNGKVAPTDDNVLRHEDVQAILLTAAERKSGSLREIFQKADIHIAHSITDIDNMFPDATAVSPGGPEFLSRPMEWVEKVLGATRPRPFSRIKSWYSDLTPDAARAKGYVTGDLKVEEVVAVLKRTTTPQTIYKLQKLDRDDILDITEFDVVMWLKNEMRMMLREEVARAILISDGRGAADDYKIVETNIRPILFDSDVYTHKLYHNDVGNEQALSAFTDAELIDLIDNISLSMQEYRGSGSPTFYCAPEVRARFMLIRDTQGNRLHPSLDALAAALGVSRVEEIPVMAGLVTADLVNPTGIPAGTYDIAHLGVIVNLNDYVIGMANGGQTSFFDDFDIDYNKYTYLYETRMSGALIHPKSAIAVNLVTAKTA